VVLAAAAPVLATTSKLKSNANIQHDVIDCFLVLPYPSAKGLRLHAPALSDKVLSQRPADWGLNRFCFSPLASHAMQARRANVGRPALGKKWVF